MVYVAGSILLVAAVMIHVNARRAFRHLTAEGERRRFWLMYVRGPWFASRHDFTPEGHRYLDRMVGWWLGGLVGAALVLGLQTCYG